jgi:hypothetical protein
MIPTQPTIKLKDSMLPNPQLPFKCKWMSPRLELARSSGFDLPPYNCSFRGDMSHTTNNCKCCLKNNPHCHWSDNGGWEMGQFIEHIVLHKTKENMQIATFFNLSSDEVTLINCQS